MKKIDKKELHFLLQSDGRRRDLYRDTAFGQISLIFCLSVPSSPTFFFLFFRFFLAVHLFLVPCFSQRLHDVWWFFLLFLSLLETEKWEILCNWMSLDVKRRKKKIGLIFRLLIVLFFFSSVDYIYMMRTWVIFFEIHFKLRLLCISNTIISKKHTNNSL